MYQGQVVNYCGQALKSEVIPRNPQASFVSGFNERASSLVQTFESESQSSLMFTITKHLTVKSNNLDFETLQDVECTLMLK